MKQTVEEVTAIAVGQRCLSLVPTMLRNSTGLCESLWFLFCVTTTAGQWLQHPPDGGSAHSQCPCQCPCVPPHQCSQPHDGRQFGTLPACNDNRLVRCCGTSQTIDNHRFPAHSFIPGSEANGYKTSHEFIPSRFTSSEDDKSSSQAGLVPHEVHLNPAAYSTTRNSNVQSGNNVVILSEEDSRSQTRGNTVSIPASSHPPHYIFNKEAHNGNLQSQNNVVILSEEDSRSQTRGNVLPIPASSPPPDYVFNKESQNGNFQSNNNAFILSEEDSRSQTRGNIVPVPASSPPPFYIFNKESQNGNLQSNNGAFILSEEDSRSQTRGNIDPVPASSPPPFYIFNKESQNGNLQSNNGAFILSEEDSRPQTRGNIVPIPASSPPPDYIFNKESQNGNLQSNNNAFILSEEDSRSQTRGNIVPVPASSPPPFYIFNKESQNGNLQSNNGAFILSEEDSRSQTRGNIVPVPASSPSPFYIFNKESQNGNLQSNNNAFILSEEDSISQSIGNIVPIPASSPPPFYIFNKESQNGNLQSNNGAFILSEEDSRSQTRGNIVPIPASSPPPYYIFNKESQNGNIQSNNGAFILSEEDSRSQTRGNIVPIPASSPPPFYIFNKESQNGNLQSNNNAFILSEEDSTSHARGNAFSIPPNSFPQYLLLNKEEHNYDSTNFPANVAISGRPPHQTRSYLRLSDGHGNSILPRRPSDMESTYTFIDSKLPDYEIYPTNGMRLEVDFDEALQYMINILRQLKDSVEKIEKYIAEHKKSISVRDQKELHSEQRTDKDNKIREMNEKKPENYTTTSEPKHDTSTESLMPLPLTTKEPERDNQKETVDRNGDEMNSGALDPEDAIAGFEALHYDNIEFSNDRKEDRMLTTRQALPQRRSDVVSTNEYEEKNTTLQNHVTTVEIPRGGSLDEENGTQSDEVQPDASLSRDITEKPFDSGNETKADETREKIVQQDGSLHKNVTENLLDLGNDTNVQVVFPIRMTTSTTNAPITKTTDVILIYPSIVYHEEGLRNETRDQNVSFAVSDLVKDDIGSNETEDISQQPLEDSTDEPDDDDDDGEDNSTMLPSVEEGGSGYGSGEGLDMSASESTRHLSSPQEIGHGEADLKKADEIMSHESLKANIQLNMSRNLSPTLKSSAAEITTPQNLPDHVRMRPALLSKLLLRKPGTILKKEVYEPSQTADLSSMEMSTSDEMEPLNFPDITTRRARIYLPSKKLKSSITQRTRGHSHRAALSEDDNPSFATTVSSVQVISPPPEEDLDRETTTVMPQNADHVHKSSSDPANASQTQPNPIARKPSKIHQRTTPSRYKPQIREPATSAPPLSFLQQQSSSQGSELGFSIKLDEAMSDQKLLIEHLLQICKDLERLLSNQRRIAEDQMIAGDVETINVEQSSRVTNTETLPAETRRPKMEESTRRVPYRGRSWK